MKPIEPLDTFMVIALDSNGVTVKSKIEDVDHVRLGIGVIKLWKDGSSRGHREMGKPHGEFSISELWDLLVELERLP